MKIFSFFWKAIKIAGSAQKTGSVGLAETKVFFRSYGPVERMQRYLFIAYSFMCLFIRPSYRSILNKGFNLQHLSFQVQMVQIVCTLTSEHWSRLFHPRTF